MSVDMRDLGAQKYPGCRFAHLRLLVSRLLAADRGPKWAKSFLSAF
jgi:hypothetical protein